jgi:hypothetical protein
LIRNVAKTVAVDFVSGFILFVSKLIVSASTGFGIFLFLSYSGSSALGVARSPNVLVLVGTVMAFMVH